MSYGMEHSYCLATRKSKQNCRGLCVEQMTLRCVSGAATHVVRERSLTSPVLGTSVCYLLLFSTLIPDRVCYWLPRIRAALREALVPIVGEKTTFLGDKDRDRYGSLLVRGAEGAVTSGSRAAR